MAASRIVKALWPPILGWVPWAIGYSAPLYFGSHGGGWYLLPIALIATLVSAPLCVANVVRIARWRDMSAWLVLALIFNASFPLGFGLLLFLSQ